MIIQKLISVRLAIALVIIALAIISFQKIRNSTSVVPKNIQSLTTAVISHPLQISEMRKRDYPGSEITIEKELAQGQNYRQYLASYLSDGLKIYALLTVPIGNKPDDGWPVIIFNHGYIPPEQYETTQRYKDYVEGFAENGFIVFKPDYRGHGDSEGEPEGAYFSPAYTIDVLSAVSSIKRFPEANPEAIGMWGHSMGGSITLRTMVVSKGIKAGVVWAGVVGSYEDLLNRWRRRVPWRPSERENMARRPTRDELIKQFGDPTTNPDFWKSISPINYVSAISGPLQLHHGLDDESVPWEFSENLKKVMEKEGQTVEYYTYPGADHNLSGPSFNQAMKRSVDFFRRYLKV